MTQTWRERLAGDIVWCYFPDGLTSTKAQKPRPALILTVYNEPPADLGVLVAYGTSQKVTDLYAGEFAISRADREAFGAAGLSFDTKFNLARRLKLPFNDEYFAVPPGAPNGQNPKLGVLHPSLVRRAAAAFNATNRETAPADHAHHAKPKDHSRE